MLNWLFLDLNSFFACCEQYDDPALRGRPVGVCPVLAGGGAVIAASYEAKRRGVGMGVRAAEARQLCPDIVLVQARPRRYIEIHHSIKKSIEHHLPITTTYSIDEWAIKLMGNERQPDTAVRLAKRIKQQIADDHDHALPCSIGFAPSRLLAKTACELHKPDGLTVLTLDQMPGILAPMTLRDIPGIGPGMDQRLRQKDITTPAELWELSRADCRRLWHSVNGEAFWLGFHGTDPVEPPTHRRSLGHAHILPPQYRNPAGAYSITTRLLCKAAMRLRHEGYAAHRLSLHIGFVSKQSWRNEIDLPGVQDTPTILQHLTRLWPWPAPAPGSSPAPGNGRGSSPAPSFAPGDFLKELPGAIPRAIPLKVGVDLSGLTPLSCTPGHLFPQADRPLRLSETLDQINRRYGGQAIHPGSMHDVIGYPMDDKIAFGRIPAEMVPL